MKSRYRSVSIRILCGPPASLNSPGAFPPACRRCSPGRSPAARSAGARATAAVGSETVARRRWRSRSGRAVTHSPGARQPACTCRGAAAGCRRSPRPGQRALEAQSLRRWINVDSHRNRGKEIPGQRAEQGESGRDAHASPRHGDSRLCVGRAASEGDRLDRRLIVTRARHAGQHPGTSGGAVALSAVPAMTSTSRSPPSMRRRRRPPATSSTSPLRNHVEPAIRAPLCSTSASADAGCRKICPSWAPIQASGPDTGAGTTMSLPAPPMDTGRS